MATIPTLHTDDGTPTVKVTFVDSLLLPYNYSFETTDGATTILNEISACRFLNESHVALVGDSGELFTASVRIRSNGTLDIRMLSRVPLEIPGYNNSVDAEGVEVSVELEDSLLISSEAPLALTWFQRATGMTYNDTTTRPLYHIPEFVMKRTKPNKGFEALTNFTSSRLVVRDAFESPPTNFLLTTTEGSLEGDPNGYHRFWIWDAHAGGDPVVELGHWASRWKELGSHNEFLSISDMDYWNDQELLLVLERGYDGTTNMIRLWGVDLGFPVTRNRQLLFDWTLDTLQLANEDIALPVDNYEAVCMFPPGNDRDKRHLLLVNDDNHNPDQIGTQFVVLHLDSSLDDIAKRKTNDTECDSAGDGCAPSSGTMSIEAIVVSSLVIGLIVSAVVYRRLRRSPISMYKERIDSEVLNSNDLELI